MQNHVVFDDKFGCHIDIDHLLSGQRTERGLVLDDSMKRDPPAISIRFRYPAVKYYVIEHLIHQFAQLIVGFVK